MKLFLDFFPILLFFVAFKFWDIYIATGVAIAATIVQIVWLRLHHGKIEAMQWLSLGVIVVFGGATLLAHDEAFIKWKPTALYWLMGGALLVGQTLLRKNFIRSLMGAQITLPDAIWRNLNWAWVGFFTVMGALNLWVAHTFDTATWVNFKLIGGMGLMIAFVVAQALYLSRYIQDDEAGAKAKDAQP
jgi:intracellular septation protein